MRTLLTYASSNLPPPPTIMNHAQQPGFDYPVQTCLTQHVSPLLDCNANHASSGCPATQRPRLQEHNAIVRTIATFAEEAGLQTKREPDTLSLLLNEFSPENCRRLFPKSSSSQSRQQLFQLLDYAQSLLASEVSKEHAVVLIQQQIDLLPPVDPKDAKGVRIDLQLEDPTLLAGLTSPLCTPRPLLISTKNTSFPLRRKHPEPLPPTAASQTSQSLPPGTGIAQNRKVFPPSKFTQVGDDEGGEHRGGSTLLLGMLSFADND
jgi:hypothetical protein